MKFSSLSCLKARCFGLVILLGFGSCHSVIQTVQGRKKAWEIKGGLTHEHVVTNFVGAKEIKESPAEENAIAISSIHPSLSALKTLGINTLFECTPRYIGRDVLLLKALSEKTGMHIVTNTGWYAAVEKKYLPVEAFSWNEKQIAAHWENEFLEGIDNTGIKPGFIKLGVGEGRLDTVEAKLLRAAILVSHNTGMSIAVHTGDGAAAKHELEIALQARLNPHKLIWVHAQNGTDKERKELAEKGVWISLDGISEKNVNDYIERILFFKKTGLLSKLLISHDDGWRVVKNGSYAQLELFGNGNKEPYETISKRLIPGLMLRGFEKGDIWQLMIRNPRIAFRLKK